MIEFVSPGCKQVGYKLRDKQTGKISAKVKLRGITLNPEISQILDFEYLVKCVENFGGGDGVTVNQFRMGPNQYYEMFSSDMEKTYRPFFTKGVVMSDNTIYPFGYCI